MPATAGAFLFSFVIMRAKKGLSQVEKLRCCPIQEKQKSRGVIAASLDFIVSIAQAVHSLLMLCDSPVSLVQDILYVQNPSFRDAEDVVPYCLISSKS